MEAGLITQQMELRGTISVHANDAVSGAMSIGTTHSVYQNSPSYTGNPPDTATMQEPNDLLYGPGTSILSLPVAWWTSNGFAGPPVTVQAEDGVPPRSIRIRVCAVSY